jgi:hypothetical protein
VTNDLTKTLADLTTWLRREQVSFAVIGGLAVGVRGEPRFTADVDVVVGLDLDAALQLVVRLSGSPFQPLFPDVAEVVRTSFILPLRHVDTGVRVDVAIGLSGFERQLLARAGEITIAGFTAPVATAEDLILMKLLASRPRDSDDVEKLAQKHGSNLDWDYLTTTAQQLDEALALDIVTPLQQLRQRHASP